MESHDLELQRQLDHAAQVGELARPLIHEFNNFLNTLLLQAAIQEAKNPNASRSEIEFLRKESQKVVKLIRDWQRLNKMRGGPQQVVDLNQVVSGCLDNLSREPWAPLNLAREHAQGPLYVKGSYIDLRRLCAMLLQAAFRGLSGPTSPETRYVVRTGQTEGQAVVRVWQEGPALAQEALAELFHPGRSVASGLELAACDSLARYQRGRLLAENAAEGGVAIIFSTALAQETPVQEP